MAFFRYADRPGVVGAVGRMLGDAGVNIAGMQVGRDAKGGDGARRAHGRLGHPGRRARPRSPTEIGAETARVVDLSAE